MMPLVDPPAAAGSLNDHPSLPLAGTELVRVWRRRLPSGDVRALPWWFASTGADPFTAGRFDLSAPNGTCYLATTVAGAVLEAMQVHLTSLPADELSARGAVRTEAPGGMPPAADLTDPAGVQRGLTAAVWANVDRPLTQRWAAAFRRDGWWALHGGLQHDLSGSLRGVSLFDHAGEHEPTHAGPWTTDEVDLLGPAALAELADAGVVVRGPGNLPSADTP
ncbi:RES family NAD+ phosphorylase [Nitriliruptoraceae bacterium ZYF776]|nr:RES family NAD+ phosphorylase [Profundirhabdus halotolerans]